MLFSLNLRIGASRATQTVERHFDIQICSIILLPCFQNACKSKAYQKFEFCINHDTRVQRLRALCPISLVLYNWSVLDLTIVDQAAISPPNI